MYMFNYFCLVFLLTLLYFWNFLSNIIYNFVFIYKSIFLIHKISNNTLDRNTITDYKNIVRGTGVFAIKMVQWGLNRFKLMTEDKMTENILEELDIFYENCPYHSDDYTKNIFKHNFNFNISDKYEFTRIASGSIAQVYKLKSIEDGKEYAMKIVHPDIRNQIYISKNICKLFLFINKYLYKYKISFDLKNFFTSIGDQANLLNEAKYIEHFYDLYKDNKYVVIPEMIDYSKDIIIMTYEQGTFYDDLHISEYKKGKIISLLELFLLNTMIVDKFVHADLHNGNWKVRTIDNSNEYQIIIYDFGLCLNLKKINIQDFYKSIINYDLKLLVDVVSEGIINIKNLEESKKILLDIVENQLDIKYMDMNRVVNVILKNCYKLDIIFDSDYLTFLLLTINFQSVSSKYSHSGGASSDYKGKDNIQKNFIKKSMYPYMITFCEYHKIFKDLSDYLKLFLSDNKCNDILFDDIEDRVSSTLNKISFSDISSNDSDSESDSDNN
jgi:predicted unusual protein kinase regulating ubiquinone biosynthesis (AarF/ABC1/UbiB family)